jgi:serine O-acetyltransferase
MGQAWSDFRADVARHGPPGGRRAVAAILMTQGLWACAQYRFARWVHRSPAARWLRPVTGITRKLIEILTGISLSAHAEIGPGLYIGHFGGVFVGRGVRMGARCSISQGVTIGRAVDGAPGSPTIGDGVYIAPGAKVFGPITIGPGAAIGANAVVNRDVPAEALAVGVPARTLDRSERPPG